LSIDRLPDSFAVVATDAAAYSRFLTSFIKRPGTGQRAFRHLVAADINAIGMPS